MMTGRTAALIIASLFFTVGTYTALATESFDRDAALDTMRILSADDMAGRRVGTPGNAKARDFLLTKIEAMNLSPVGGTYQQPFSFTPRSAMADGRGGSPVKGVNLLFQIKGQRQTKQTIVLSAHYDHVGVRGGETYNGADDNASGVAGLFALAEHFLKKPPEHNLVFALFDAEEVALQGARAFVEAAKTEGREVILNINLDMISRNDRNELYVAGAYHSPQLKPVLEEIARQSPVKLRMGHDRPELDRGDWTMLSDHGPFHKAGIPFLYFGVEDHPHYHKPSDDYETVPHAFFLKAIETIVLAAEVIDDHLIKRGL